MNGADLIDLYLVLCAGLAIGGVLALGLGALRRG